MSRLNSKSPTNKTHHILHPLNLSKTKTVFSFEKAKRFTDPQSYSPNKFYNLPSTLNRISCSIGIGSRHKAEKPHFIQPTKYNIVSEFDLKGHKRTSSASFGIGREEYYKGHSTKNLLGPGTYDISRDLSSKKIYIGQKLRPLEDKNQIINQLNITGETLRKLSTHKNENGAYRMKTEYYPKHQLDPYDNKVPGPGAYDQEIKNSSTPRKGTLTTFGITQKLKTDKPSWLGPGSYDIFSQFGKPE